MLDWIRNNWIRVNLQFQKTAPKHAKHPWKGDWVQVPTVWLRGEHARLYIPFNAYILQAGYIDLNKQMYRLGSDLDEDQKIEAEIMLSKALKWLQEQVEK